jgi:hypothetical protein
MSTTTNATRAEAPAPQSAPALSEKAGRFRDRVLSWWKFRVFLWLKLPLAALARLRLRRLEAGAAEVTVPAGWRNQNPFGSLYFAAHAMAAEMSTGVLVLLHTQDASVSTLITGMQATYGKAAKSLVTYRCEDGARIAAAARTALETGDPVTVEVTTRGTCEGEPCAEFRFTWSMRRRSRS